MREVRVQKTAAMVDTGHVSVFCMVNVVRLEGIA